ncbi:MAG: ribosome biosis protein [Ferruginibacter sp.]|nr:ribosome biosis protein [Ferruginibacter sp.]
MVAGLFFTMATYGQIRKVPAAVTEAFATKYPAAKNVEWGDKVTVFEATFDVDGKKQQASFNSDGEWKFTERFIEAKDLPAAVQEGLNLSKYKDWEIKSYVEINEADGAPMYRLYGKKNYLQKKYLYFNTDGQLVKDSITL